MSRRGKPSRATRAKPDRRHGPAPAGIILAQSWAPLRILPTPPQRSVIHPKLETDTMTPVINPSPTLDPARAIHRLHRRLEGVGEFR